MASSWPSYGHMAGIVASPCALVAGPEAGTSNGADAAMAAGVLVLLALCD